MSTIIRDVREHELDSVLALNNAAGPTILPMDAAKARYFLDQSTYFRVAEVDGHLAGFLIAFDQDAPYQSSNFLWFRERMPSFVYIDRVVVASSRRGAGLGRVFYADVQSFAEVRAHQLTCEVFLEPRNDVAVLFHGTYGFHEVGQQLMPETGLRVSLLAKELASFSWVQQTYLAAGGELPDLPWLRARARGGESAHLATGT
jgi:predicted GNAT superfamily acetyltransferase